jgi:hypothetical protein
MSADAPDDASIPVLTERLTLPPLDLDTSLPMETSEPGDGPGLAIDTTLPVAPPPMPAPPRAAPAAARPDLAPTSYKTSSAGSDRETPAAPILGSARETAPVLGSPRDTSTAQILGSTRDMPTAPMLGSARDAPASAVLGSARETPVAPIVGSARETPTGPISAGSHWTRIELELRSSILQAIADALPQHIDDIVRSKMNEAIERLVTQLAAETRLAVAASLHDVVDQAVRSELARLRAHKR